MKTIVSVVVLVLTTTLSFSAKAEKFKITNSDVLKVSTNTKPQNTVIDNSVVSSKPVITSSFANDKLCKEVKSQMQLSKYNKTIDFDVSASRQILKNCDSKKDSAKKSPSVHRFSSFSHGASSITNGETVYTDDITFDISPESQTLLAGETAVFDVHINWDESTTQLLLVTNSELGPTTQLFNVTKDVPGFFVNSNRSDFQITVETSPLLSDGDYDFYILALTNESLYTRKFTYSLTIESNQSAAADPINNTATATFSPTWLNGPTVTQYYDGGTYTATQASAYFDANGDGILNAIAGDDSVAFPAMPDAFLNVTQGRAYAGDSNIIVYAVLSEYDFVAVHFQVLNDTVTPILALAGNTSTGIILIQDVGLTSLSIEGELPSANGNGYLVGSIGFDPFIYDGASDQNIIYANHVNLEFSVALQRDDF